MSSADEVTPPNRPTVAETTQPLAPSVAGRRFVVLRPHARGGLGKVSVALDSELNRNVALKEIREEYADDPYNQWRFLQEAEITGQLEHPGIVPVYGLGTDRDGRPYYAMRFVEGDSLRAAIESFHKERRDLHSLNGTQAVRFRGLIGRFVDACNAIQYAHSRQVIHRDLKPENIMLGPFGETLIVDWGLAKSLDLLKSESTLGRDPRAAGPKSQPIRLKSGSGVTPTIEGAAVGTPAFMSPEQAAGKLSELGPATDIYSLGATLYYLLTGRAPFQGDDAGAILQAVRRGDFTPPRQIWSGAPRPLEAICLKAMSNKETERYASPRALADDVERWLAGEPVTACPEPILVRCRRWLNRHPALTSSVAAAVILSLAGAILVAAISQRHAAELERNNNTISKQNQDLERSNLTITKQNQELEKSNATVSKQNQELEASNKTIAAQNQTLQSQNQTISTQKADLEVRNKELDVARQEETRAKERAEAVSKYLIQMFRSPDPDSGKRDLKVVDLLDQQAPRLMKEFDGDPILRAGLLDAISESYFELGAYAKAIPLYEMALQIRQEHLPIDAIETIASMNRLGRGLRLVGRRAEALKIHEDAAKRSEQKLGATHNQTLNCLSNLAAAFRALGDFQKAHVLSERVYNERRNGPQDGLGYHVALNDLGLSYLDLGRALESIPLLEKAAENSATRVGKLHSETLNTRANLANAYRAAGQKENAQIALKAVIDGRTKMLGENHPSTLNSRAFNATWLQQDNKLTEAIAQFSDILQRCEKSLGAESPQTLFAKSNLAAAYAEKNDYPTATKLYEETLAVAKKDPARYAMQLDSISRAFGRMYHGQGDYAKAMAVYHSAEILLSADAAVSRPLILSLQLLNAESLRDARRSKEAVLLAENVYKSRRELFGEEAVSTYLAASTLSSCYHAIGRNAESIEILQNAAKGLTARAGSENIEAINMRLNLASQLIDVGRAKEAHESLLMILKSFEARKEVESTNLANAYSLLAVTELILQAPVKAQSAANKCLAIRIELAVDTWRIDYAKSLVGWSLFAQGKSSEAEKLLVEGAEGVLSEIEKTPASFEAKLIRVVEQVIALKKAQAKLEEAAKWQTKLEDLKKRIALISSP